MRRHHHLLKDFPGPTLLQDHLLQEGLDGDAIHQMLAWRAGIQASWGNQFSYEDGRPMTLYDAWLHGADLARASTSRTRDTAPLRRVLPTRADEPAPLDVPIPTGQGNYGQLMGRLMQRSLRATPRLTPRELAAQCREWMGEYPACQEALARAAWQFDGMEPKESVPF